MSIGKARHTFRALLRGTKRLVSVNICSVESNSDAIAVSKVSPEIFVIIRKDECLLFSGDKTAVLGTIKAQLSFSEGKYQLLTAPFNNMRNLKFKPLATVAFSWPLITFK